MGQRLNDRFDSDPLIQVPEREPDLARNEERAGNIGVALWLAFAVLAAWFVVRVALPWLLS